MQLLLFRRPGTLKFADRQPGLIGALPLISFPAATPKGTWNVRLSPEEWAALGNPETLIIDVDAPAAKVQP